MVLQKRMLLVVIGTYFLIGPFALQAVGYEYCSRGYTTGYTEKQDLEVCLDHVYRANCTSDLDCTLSEVTGYKVADCAFGYLSYASNEYLGKGTVYVGARCGSQIKYLNSTMKEWDAIGGTGSWGKFFAVCKPNGLAQGTWLGFRLNWGFEQLRIGRLVIHASPKLFIGSDACEVTDGKLRLGTLSSCDSNIAVADEFGNWYAPGIVSLTATLGQSWYYCSNCCYNNFGIEFSNCHLSTAGPAGGAMWSYKRTFSRVEGLIMCDSVKVMLTGLQGVTAASVTETKNVFFGADENGWSCSVQYGSLSDDVYKCSLHPMGVICKSQNIGFEIMFFKTSSECNSSKMESVFGVSIRRIGNGSGVVRELPVACPPGTWSTTGLTSQSQACPNACPPGKWGTTIGAASANQACPNSCPAGTWGTATGATSQGTACPNACRAGSYGAASLVAQTSQTYACPYVCPAGRFGDPSLTGQVTLDSACPNYCPTGTFGQLAGQVTQASACQACSPPPSNSTFIVNCTWACNAGYFRSSTGDKCTPTVTTCPIGYYNNFGVCQKCLNLVNNASFTSDGGNDAHGCSWSCNFGYYKCANACIVCSILTCSVGQYRRPCGTISQVQSSCESSDSICIPCTEKPSNALYTSKPHTSNNCSWECFSGYFLEGLSCRQCSNDQCMIGHYQRTCSGTSDSSCVPCTRKPANSIFTSVGSPISMDNCSWICKDGYYFDGQICTMCSDLECTVGHFFTSCNANWDATCLPCTGNPPNSQFTSSPDRSEKCIWSCNTGFYKNGQSCTLCPADSESCPIGQYRRTCDATTQSSCLPCTGKPSNAVFVSAGIPVTTDNCTWVCASGFVLIENQMKSCADLSSYMTDTITLTFIATLPMNMQSFLERKDDFVRSVAVTANIDVKAVTIKSIAEVTLQRNLAARIQVRRLLGIFVEVETSVVGPSKTLTSLHDSVAINANLAKVSLPACTVALSSPGYASLTTTSRPGASVLISSAVFAVVTTPSPSAALTGSSTSDVQIPIVGIVGGAVGIFVLAGLFVIIWRYRSSKSDTVKVVTDTSSTDQENRPSTFGDLVQRTDHMQNTSLPPPRLPLSESVTLSSHGSSPEFTGVMEVAMVK